MVKSSALVSGLYALGMLIGFLRDMTLVREIGTGGATDAFLIAVFLPDALRMTIASGVIAAAFLPLWATLAASDRPRMAASATLGLLAATLGIALSLRLLAPILMTVLGPGLTEAGRETAIACFDMMVWAIPALSIYGLLGAIHNNAHRFVLPAAGSVIYNGVAIAYLLAAGRDSSVEGLSLANCAATLSMVALLVPGAWRCGWRPLCNGAKVRDFTLLARRLGPLLLSASAGHAAVLLERALGSLIGEGTVTLINLARKIVSLPIAAVNSLAQVVLPRFVHAHVSRASAALRRELWLSLGIGTLLTWPASLTLALWAPAMSTLVLPSGSEDQRQTLGRLFAAFAFSVVPACWNILLARGYYAQDDMVTPTRFELIGMAVHLGGLLVMFRLFGVWAVPAAVFGAALVTTTLLQRNSPLRADTALCAKASAALAAASGLLYAVAALFEPRGTAWSQFGFAAAFLAALTGAGATALWFVRSRSGELRPLPLAPQAAEPP